MISCHSSAPPGSVSALSSYEPSSFPANACILCRNTAPLISMAFGLIRRGVGCRVLGKEIGTGLVTLVKKLNALSLDDLDRRLDLYEKREREKFLRKGEDQAAQDIEDKCSCLRVFISAQDPSATIDVLCLRIAALFDDGPSGLLTLSTVHKAKGLEWPTVFILDKAKLMPSKFARTPWAKRQEMNLIYVALTRAQEHLRYIDSGNWKREERLTPEQRAQQED